MTSKPVMTPHIRSLYCKHPLKGPDGEATKITSISTHWNGIPGDGTFFGPQTPLNGTGPKDVPGILELMKQRGWKDHFMVHYDEKMDASADSEADADGCVSSSSDFENNLPSSAEQEESQPSASKSDYHPSWSLLADVPVGPPAADHEILTSLLERESKH